jgi:Uma2 family endonuclease
MILQNACIDGNSSGFGATWHRGGNGITETTPTDVFVIFGAGNRKRHSYKPWQEGGKLPKFLLEITSRSTKHQDQEEKRLYARL